MIFQILISSVSWVIGAKIDQDFAQQIMDVVTKPEMLEEVVLKFETNPPLLKNLHHLRKLVIRTDLTLDETMSAFSRVQTIVGKSPNLRCLGLALKNCDTLISRGVPCFPAG
jgi:hypothetical protein